MANNSGERLAQIRDLTITYARHGEPPIHALEKVNLEIRSGEIVGMLGESGSGKSTLALSLLRLLPEYARYDGGCILFRGRELLQFGESELRRLRGQEISLIPQDPALSLNPVMTVGDQIAEVMRAHLPLNGKERRKGVLELLTEVGFDAPQEIFHAYPHQLSGGQRQRIAISQAIACRPALVIADEPTSKLDAPLQADIISLLAAIQKRHGIAFLFITHDPSILVGFAQRIVVMYAGSIVEDAASRWIFNRPLHPYTQALVNLTRRCAAPLVTSSRTRLPVIEGTPPDLSVAAAGCRFEPRCSQRMDMCTLREPVAATPEACHQVSCFKYGN